MVVAIACGGTGGHLFPGIAVAQALKARGHSVLIVISQKEIDTLAMKGHADLPTAKVPSVGLTGIGKIPVFLWKSFQAYRMCRRLLREAQVDAVLGMGGFTSTPPILAGKHLGLPTFIHESNAIPGKANRLTSKFTTEVLLGLEGCAEHFPGRSTRVVGTPLRDALKAEISPAEAFSFFGLKDDRKTILVTGGSQGAQGVNHAVTGILGKFDASKVQIIHLTGKHGYDEAKDIYDKFPIRHYLAPFCQEMHLAYEIADIVITRSGASSMTEIAHFGIPSIMIPYPHAAEDHQTANAKVFVRGGASIMLKESELTSDSMHQVLSGLLESEERCEMMSKAAKKLSGAGSADRIAELIEEHIGATG